MANKINTVEFLAVWEELHNPDFNRVQFEAVRSEAGLNRFVMTPTKWIEQTNAIGIVSKAGRYGGGTYAHLIPQELTPEQIAYTYASEADLLNVALFGQTAKQWKNNNPDKKGNVRDDANLNQLLVLANMESYNAKIKNA